jgi:hypothetical protein
MPEVLGFGAKYWDVTGIRYDQENNVIEQVFHDLKMAGKLPYYLESCNVEATACGIESVGGLWRYPLPSAIGGKGHYPVQGDEVITFMGQGDLMFFFLNAIKVKPFLPSISPTITENEFIENLEYAVPRFSTAHAKVRYFNTSDDIDIPMIASLKMGRSLVLSYDTDGGAGHYITVVYYNVRDRVFICYDPWADNKHCKKGGVKEEYPAAFFKARMQGHRSRFMEVWV